MNGPSPSTTLNLVSPCPFQVDVLLPPSLACTTIPLLLYLDLWRSSVCLASSTALLLPHHLEAVALELHALAESEVLAEAPEAGAVTEERTGKTATRACTGGAEGVCAAVAERASLDKATEPVPGQACAGDGQERQEMQHQRQHQQQQQQQPEQQSVQSFMKDLMQDLVDYAEFCERRRLCTSPQVRPCVSSRGPAIHFLKVDVGLAHAAVGAATALMTEHEL